MEDRLFTDAFPRQDKNAWVASVSHPHPSPGGQNAWVAPVSAGTRLCRHPSLQALLLAPQRVLVIVSVLPCQPRHFIYSAMP
jgi:hypothetical protein